MPFVKLDTGILDSTLWLSDPDVRVVFITMLAMAKPDGLVEATAPGIARRANLSIEATREAIKVLEAPDEDSRSLADEGRRIRRVDGGYQLTNYGKYRDKDHTAAERKRRERERKKQEAGQGVTRDGCDDTPDVTHSDPDSSSDISPDGDIGDGKPPPACPHQAIIDLYHETLPELRRVKEWTQPRRNLLRTRWREKPERQSLEWWRSYFEIVSRSDFLMGRKVNGERPFRADLEWLIKPANMVKVLEGKYNNEESRSDGAPFDGYEAAN